MTELASQHLDRELALGARLRFRLHLMMCVHCRRFVRQLRATVALLATLVEAPARVAPGDAGAERLAAELAGLPRDDTDTG